MMMMMMMMKKTNKECLFAAIMGDSACWHSRIHYYVLGVSQSACESLSKPCSSQRPPPK
jgi:hypothetical protein